MTEMNPPPASAPEPGKMRLASVDALRGFTMFWISFGVVVFIELLKVFEGPTAEAILRQFSHAAWEGFTFYDLIFPMFLFLVGVVLPFSLKRRAKEGAGRGRLLWHIARRAVILIFLGLILNGLMQFEFGDDQMRWPGVLQRIGICYFFGSLIVLSTGWRGQATTAASILVVYWLMVTFIPVPEFGAGVITPEGCLPAYIDRLLIPGRFCCFTFGDNEGLLSTLPAVASVLVGTLTGHGLLSKASGSRKVVTMALAGGACLLVGYLWGLSFPIIKNIWTSSYVLVAGGWSLLLMALFYWVIDVLGFKKWAMFFIVIGMNSILAYVVVRLVDFSYTAEKFAMGIANLLGDYKEAFLALSTFTLIWLFLYFLYRNKFFIKV
jgi:predicted acyltransferase